MKTRLKIAHYLLAGCVLPLAMLLKAGEVIPPKPDRYFNDYASVVPSGTAAALNKKLEDFERATSSQILVAVYPKMQTDSSIEDYTVRIAQAWHPGQKQKDNGAVLFVFIQDRKMFIQIGYGLEGALTDALCKQIIENEIKPPFKNGNYAAGLTQGVDALLKAARGEYQGTGQTNASRNKSRNKRIPWPLVFVGCLILLSAFRRSRGTIYGSRGRSSWGSWGMPMGGGWTSRGGGSGGSSGGGGGFSSGGGNFGGGGAGGSW